MAASAGTNPGSMPEGVGVGVGVRVGDGVGDGESLADGVEEGDASTDGELLELDVGAGRNAAAEVQPARTNAVAMAVEA